MLELILVVRLLSIARRNMNQFLLTHFFPSDQLTEKYCLVIALTVLDEVADKGKFLNELKLSLKVEGDLIVTVRNTNCWLQ